ncbi:MAG: YggS family pyridoxal phosphate-dependent enzyme [Coleofasciculaceae cyanobacterium RL_1_1]|nr:YggS family pyridoxal phosphate-dependent enzyme [Coleofasciculaceae cyanobacterium RL_1_1]
MELTNSARIAQRIAELRSELPQGVRAIAVSKYKPVSAIRAAYAAGVRDIGESRIQEVIEKRQLLADLPDITWHFIGHLQSNKVNAALANVDWIHSVDSLKLAQRIDRAITSDVPSPKLCLQVKFAPDPDKFGWEADELLRDWDDLEALERLDVRGLMTIAPLGLTEGETRALFERAQQFLQGLRVKAKRWALEELSMGMSNDYRLAIAAGTTAIRVGRTIFGER